MYKIIKPQENKQEGYSSQLQNGIENKENKVAIQNLIKWSL